MFESFELAFMNVVPPILVGAALLYALLRRRRLSVREQEARNEGTREQYRDERWTRQAGQRAESLNQARIDG